jgi:hypothetical protein
MYGSNYTPSVEINSAIVWCIFIGESNVKKVVTPLGIWNPSGNSEKYMVKE